MSDYICNESHFDVQFHKCVEKIILDDEKSLKDKVSLILYLVLEVITTILLSLK